MIQIYIIYLYNIMRCVGDNYLILIDDDVITVLFQKLVVRINTHSSTADERLKIKNSQKAIT